MSAKIISIRRADIFEDRDADVSVTRRPDGLFNVRQGSHLIVNVSEVRLQSVLEAIEGQE